MSFLDVPDGARLHYVDIGPVTAEAILLSHSWPLHSEMWTPLAQRLTQHGYRVIVHDRRGAGRSSGGSGGNTLDQFADDLARLIEALDLRSIALVGHGAASAEIARYIARHGASRVGRIVLIGALLPLFPVPDPGHVEEICRLLTHERLKFLREYGKRFYGLTSEDEADSIALLDPFCQMGMISDAQAQIETFRATHEADVGHDLKRFTVPTLFVGGEEDRIVDFHRTTTLSHALVRNSEVRNLAGESHGVCITCADLINAEIIAFLAD